MTRWHRGTLACLVALPLMAAALVFGTATIRYYGYNDAGQMVWVATVDYETDDDGGTYGTVCFDLVGMMCRVACSSCHQVGKSPAMKYKAHVGTYYPRAEYRLAEGQRFKFSRGSVRLESGRLAFYNLTGKRLAVAPAGSRLLKGRDGTVKTAYLTGDPVTVR
jgi:hypothetical protein